MLTDKEIEKYRDSLTNRMREVNELILTLSERCEPVSPDPSIGRLTRNDAMQDQQVALQQRRRLNAEKIQIDAALERIRKGSFGICALCKGDINMQRLYLMPTSPLCIPCMETKNAGHSR